jgi:hypothetical protein
LVFACVYRYSGGNRCLDYRFFDDGRQNEDSNQVAMLRNLALISTIIKLYNYIKNNKYFKVAKDNIHSYAYDE